MDTAELLKKLERPTGKVDVVLDTDTYNEIDDQFALSYMIKSGDMLNVKAVYAAPFFNEKSTGPADGMEKSYHEILKVLDLLEREDLKACVFRGSDRYLSSETEPVISDAAKDLAERAMTYTEENPLYVVAIGAITNFVYVILQNPDMKGNCVIVWLGGHAVDMPRGADEFNMIQDIAAARVVFGCGVPLIQLPCAGVVDRFATTKYELQHWLCGKNKLCDYLYEHTVQTAESYAAGKPWSRVIWDVTAVAWLLNKDGRFMHDRLIASPIPEYDGSYGIGPDRHLIRYVYHIDRDALFEDLFNVLGEKT